MTKKDRVGDFLGSDLFGILCVPLVFAVIGGVLATGLIPSLIVEAMNGDTSWWVVALVVVWVVGSWIMAAALSGAQMPTFGGSHPPLSGNRRPNKSSKVVEKADD